MMGNLVEVAMREAWRRRNCRRCHLLWRLKPHPVLVCRLHRRSNRCLESCRHSWRHKLQIFQPHSTPSRLQVSRRVRPLASRRARSILTSAIALRSRDNVWSTPKPPLVSPLINRHKFHSSWGSLNKALFNSIFDADWQGCRICSYGFFSIAIKEKRFDWTILMLDLWY